MRASSVVAGGYEQGGQARSGVSVCRFCREHLAEQQARCRGRVSLEHGVAGPVDYAF